MSKYLILISIDALNAKDHAIFKHYPVFQDFIENGSYFPKVTPIYPSLTYPCHTSIITGTPPNVHGIFNNEVPEPDKAPKHDWFWYEKDIKAPTLFDAAYSAGLTSAAVLYPVMAGSKSITYNFPEIFSNTGESQLSLFWKNGSRSLLFDALRHASKAKGTQQPYLDNFSSALFKDILRKKKPQLSALHLTELDDARHHHGTFSTEAKAALLSAAKRVEEIITLTTQMGIYEDTTFAIFGDHGFQDYRTAISFNRLLKDLGFLQTDEQGKITEWKAYGANADGSLQLYLYDPQDIKLQSQMEILLDALLELPQKPFKACYTRAEANLRFQLNGPFSYVLEANDGYAFVQPILDHYLTPVDRIPGSYLATHGFLPSQPNLKTALLIKGPDIRKHLHLQEISLLDEAPTFAKILDLPWQTGQALDIFRRS